MGFNYVCNKTENILSYGAAIPLVGSVCGAAKFVLGTSQALVALVVGILTTPMRCCGDPSLNKHCWSHFKHGLGNMAAGLVETIPVVQGVMTLARLLIKDSMTIDGKAKVWSKHEFKFMPYKDLVHSDFKIVGQTDAIKEYVTTKVNEAYEFQAEQFDRELTNKEKYKIAKIVCKGTIVPEIAQGVMTDDSLKKIFEELDEHSI